MGRCRVGFVPVLSSPGVNNVLVQSKEDHGNGVRASGFELQRPENDWAREREHRAHLRWDFPPLRWRVETYVEGGFRAQEKETAGCAIAMPQIWMRKQRQPRLILSGRVERLLSELSS